MIATTLTICAEQPGDRAAVHALHRAAFGGDGESDLVDALRDEGAVVLSLVAAEQEHIVGHVLYSRLIIEGHDVGASALAPISVDPSRRRLGIGTRLIEEAHRLLRVRGESLVFVLGEPGYYARFGFTTEAARSFRTPYDGEYMQALRLSADTPASGTVAYPAPFARLG
jgi:putative acetyltransferase